MAQSYFLIGAEKKNERTYQAYMERQEITLTNFCMMNTHPEAFVTCYNYVSHCSSVHMDCRTVSMLVWIELPQAYPNNKKLVYVYILAK